MVVEVGSRETGSARTISSGTSTTNGSSPIRPRSVARPRVTGEPCGIESAGRRLPGAAARRCPPVATRDGTGRVCRLRHDRLRPRRTGSLPQSPASSGASPTGHLAAKLSRDILGVCRRSEECTAHQSNQHGARTPRFSSPSPRASIVASALRACSTSGRKLATGWSYLRRN